MTLTLDVGGKGDLTRMDIKVAKSLTRRSGDLSQNYQKSRMLKPKNREKMFETIVQTPDQFKYELKANGMLSHRLFRFEEVRMGSLKEYVGRC